MFKTLKSTYALELMMGIFIELHASPVSEGKCHIHVGPVRIMFASANPRVSTKKGAVVVREGNAW